MLQLFIAILGIILTIFFVVGVHEFGHFIVARWVGVKVQRFSIGFGKALWRWQDKKGTEYVFAPIPLGGYVKMLDESEGEVPPEELHLAYNQQPIYKKLAIVIAGPAFNLIFAFILYWAIFMIGFTSIVPIVGKITPNSIAATAGIKSGDEILRIDDKSTPTWASIVINLLFHTGNQDNLKIDTQNPISKNIQRYSLDLTNWRMDDLKPNPLESLGITPYEPQVPAIIKNISPKSPALGILKVDDKILAIENTPIKDWYDVAKIIDKHPETTLSFSIEREGKITLIPITTLSKRDLFFKKHGFVGISPEVKWPESVMRKNKYSPGDAFVRAWENTRDFINLNFIILGKMLTGKISLKSLGGPITIFESAGNALNNGMLPFISFLAFLSIAIGVLNILPIPGLDGGHVLFQAIEFIIRRPVPIDMQVLLYRLGLIFLLLLMTQALVNDILRL